MTSFDRDCDWTIDKTNEEPNPIEAAPGQTYDADYEITVGALCEDFNWAVSV